MFESPDGIFLSAFLTFVGQLKFRGTSVLFRLKHSPIRREPPLPGPQSSSSSSSTNVGHLKKPPRGGLDVIRDEGVEGEDQMDTGGPVVDHLKKPAASGSRILQKASTVGSIPSSVMCEEGDEDPLRGSVGFNNKEYSIATHFVKVHRSGVVADVMTLWDLAGTEAVSGSTLESILSHSNKPGFDRLPSINAFDKVWCVCVCA